MQVGNFVRLHLFTFIFITVKVLFLFDNLIKYKIDENKTNRKCVIYTKRIVLMKDVLVRLLSV